MPRPRKTRILTLRPRQAVFKPAGVPLSQLDEVVLLYEELEALRLADLEGKKQAEAADEMGISRSTFQRILDHARQQISKALVEGNALRLQGATITAKPPTPRGPRRKKSLQDR